MNNPKNLSDIFGRFFVVAGYLPALAFLTLLRWLILPGLPAETQQQVSLFKETGYIPEFTVLLIIPVFLAAILISLTDTTVQLYAGRSLLRFGKPLPAKYREFNKLIKQIEDRIALLQITDLELDDELKTKIHEASDELEQLIVDLKKMTGGVILFKPTSLHLTRLGNVLASLNEYTDRRYAMNAGTIWPRLKAILPKEFDERLKSQNTSFMFMLNLSICCLFFALIWILFGIASLAGWSHVNTSVWMIVFISVCVGAYLFYRASVAEASLVVETMTTAFDLFRGNLLEKLGLNSPSTMEEEKNLWRTLTSFLLLGPKRFDSSKIKATSAKRFPKTDFKK